jgi:hypothetical protein
MDYVEPKKIISPISGLPVEPRIITNRIGNKIIKEAHWIDPSSGAFIRKGIVSIEEVKQS